MSPFLPHSLNLTTAVEALQSILRPTSEEIVQEQRVKNKGSVDIHRNDIFSKSLISSSKYTRESFVNQPVQSHSCSSGWGRTRDPMSHAGGQTHHPMSPAGGGCKEEIQT